MSSKKTSKAVKKATPRTPAADFASLVSTIVHIHQETQAFATKAVNVSLTLRNWLIGRQIEVYERQGADRASYGDRLMDTLVARLKEQGLERCDRRELYRFRQFYLAYPEIVETLSPQSMILPSLQPLLALLHQSPASNRETLSPESQIVESLSPQLLTQLSFSHLTELSDLPDATQRRFYELECIRGNWSVRELRRQIGSLYYQRSGLSKNKARLSAKTHVAADTLQPAHIIRDPYVFEFLGLRSRDVMAESDLEDALLDRLQDFLLEPARIFYTSAVARAFQVMSCAGFATEERAGVLERYVEHSDRAKVAQGVAWGGRSRRRYKISGLSHGFCFEARQKCILIGDDHFFIDLVFYHRVLKCHILVELKTEAFRHEHLGQLNTYVAHYKKHQMTAGDQSPIGILLCTRKNDALVEFALGDLSNKVFVSRYAVNLPKKEEMERFICQLGNEEKPPATSSKRKGGKQ